MISWKEKAHAAYKKECFKQTMPYQYEIMALDKARGVQTGGPLVSALGNVVYYPNLAADVLDFTYVLSEYIVFMGHDGLPETDAVLQLIDEAQGADIIYPDEDFLDIYASGAESLDDALVETLFRTPFKKPDYSPDTLMSFPYMGSCFAVRTAFARTVPRPAKTLEIPDEVRIYDFLLRCMQKTDKIKHVPEILFHRFLPEDVKKDEDGQISDEAIYESLYKIYNKAGYCLARDAAKSRLGYDDIPESEDGSPLVSVIIPSKDHSAMLKTCIDDVLEARDGHKIEIIVVDNGSAQSEKEAVEEYLNGIKNVVTKYIYEEEEFNFSKMCNTGANAARGSYLLFLNDDVEAEDSTFLTQMLKTASLPHVGAVGVKLLYPDWQSIQHVGITDINRGPSHKLLSFDDRKNHYFGRNKYVWDVLAVTGACLMVSKEKYFNAGGFHDKMKVGYNDVDLCVKLYEQGYYNVADCTVALIHHESVARGYDSKDAAKRARLKEERTLFYELHPWVKEYGDPFYAKGLDMDTVSYEISVPVAYKLTDLRNQCRMENKFITRPSAKVSFNTERFEYEPGIAGDAEDAYVFEGWSLINKADNALYSRLFCLIPLDEDDKFKKPHLECKVCPKYREDVRKVFPDAKNARLAGFVCRIPASCIARDVTYRLAMAEYAPGFMHKYITIGDKFSVERGIIKDE